MKVMDETIFPEALEVIEENKRYEEKVSKLLGDLPVHRQGTIFTMLIVKAAIQAKMPKDILLEMISAVYDMLRKSETN
jgi:hypothetical protein